MGESETAEGRDARLIDIRLLVTDVDGVLTDGSMIFHADGTESKTFSARDGSGIKYLMRNEIQVAMLSARDCDAVRRRADSLGIEHCITGARDKLPAYRALLERLGLADAQACYVGDDLTDIPPMRAAGFPVAVADAAAEVRDVAALVTSAAGGHGAVREVAELILKAQGKWDNVMRRYLA